MVEQATQSRMRSVSACELSSVDPDAKYHAKVHSMYSNRAFFHHPKMKALVFATLQNPEKDVVIPEGFLEAGRVKMIYRLLPLHKLVILIYRAILAIRCAFSKPYKRKFEAAALKVSVAYAKFLRDEAEKKAERVQANTLRMRNVIIKHVRPIVRVRELQRLIATDQARIEHLKHSQTGFGSRVQILRLATDYAEIDSWKRSFGAGSETKAKICRLDSNFNFATLPESIAGYQAMVNMHEERAAEITTLEKIQANREHLIRYQTGKQEEAEKIQQEKEIRALALRQQILDDIGEKAHPDIKALMTQFFAHFDVYDIESWDVDFEGNFTLRLKEPLRLWVPSKDDEGNEDPIGGLVMLLGHGDDKTVKGKLSKSEKGDTSTGELYFESGFNSFVFHKFPWPWNEQEIHPEIIRMRCDVKQSDGSEPESKFTFSAGIRIFGKRWEKGKVKDLPYLLRNWENNGEVVGRDYEDFLRKKRAESLADAKANG